MKSGEAQAAPVTRFLVAMVNLNDSHLVTLKLESTNFYSSKWIQEHCATSPCGTVSKGIGDFKMTQVIPATTAIRAYRGTTLPMAGSMILYVYGIVPADTNSTANWSTKQTSAFRSEKGLSGQEDYALFGQWPAPETYMYHGSRDCVCTWGHDLFVEGSSLQEAMQGFQWRVRSWRVNTISDLIQRLAQYSTHLRHCLWHWEIDSKQPWIVRFSRASSHQKQLLLPGSAQSLWSLKKWDTVHFLWEIFHPWVEAYP